MSHHRKKGEKRRIDDPHKKWMVTLIEDNNKNKDITISPAEIRLIGRGDAKIIDEDGREGTLYFVLEDDEIEKLPVLASGSIHNGKNESEDER